MFFQTGIDRGSTGTKKICILAFPPFSYYRLVGESEKGKHIYVIPSHRVLLKSLPKDLKDTASARKYIEEEFLSLLKGREVLWKIWWNEGSFKALFAEPEGRLPKGAFWDAEPVALTRAFLSLGLKDGEVWDFGKKKITQVEIKKGRLHFFRVFWEIPKDVVSSEKKIPVLLCGGGSQTEEVIKLFKEIKLYRIKNVSPEKVTAFGAALWGVLGRGLPVFHSSTWEIPPQTAKKLSTTLIFSIVLMCSVWSSFKFLTPKMIQKFQIKEKKIFKKFYPNTPVVSPLTQVEAMVETIEHLEFYKILKDLLSKLPKNVKIYSLNYDGVKIKIKIEVQENDLKSLPGQITSVKKLPGGTEIVEIVFPSGEKR